ncbi:MAG: hypothetical protein HY775_10080 [Acidobacteria bacterium]|nr:hypothetical protein [Acidobacteriota bacterium]
MARCPMCGFDVPVDPDGRCFLGHRVHEGPPPAESAPPPAALQEPPPGIEIAARPGYEALAALADRVAPPEGPVFTSRNPYEELTALAPAGIAAGATPETAATSELAAASSPLLGFEPLFGVDELFDSAPVVASGAPALLTDRPAEAPAPVVAPTMMRAVVAEPAAPPEVAPEPPPGPSRELFVGTPKHRGRRALALVLALLLIGGGAGWWFLFGPARGTAEGAAYRRLFVANEAHRYSLAMTMKGTVDAGGAVQPFDVSMDMRFAERTLKVDPAGTATVRYEVQGASMSANGTTVPLPFERNLSITATVAPDGKVLSAAGSAGFGFSDLGPVTDLFGPESFGPLLPSDRVRPGDTWTVTETQRIPFLESPLRTVTRNKLLRIRTEGGERLAVIRSRQSMPLNLRMKIADVMKAAATMSGQAAPDLQVPPDAVFEYSGSSSMDLIQTIVAATGRPTAVTGSGVMDMTLKMKGIPGVGASALRMHFDITVDLAELGASGVTA